MDVNSVKIGSVIRAVASYSYTLTPSVANLNLFIFSLVLTYISAQSLTAHQIKIHKLRTQIRYSRNYAWEIIINGKKGRCEVLHFMMAFSHRNNLELIH